MPRAGGVGSLMVRGAKSQANLKGNQGIAGPGRPKLTAQEKQDKQEVRTLSRKLLTDPQYRKSLLRRLREGTIQPGVEAMLWYYAHGKPQETIEAKVIPIVNLKHEYTE